MMPFPRSAFDLTNGLVYFARMCDKIRLHAAGELPAEYHQNLGSAFDGRMCGYLNVAYPSLRDQVLTGLNDEEALEWCYSHGRRLNDLDLLIWNGFATKRGWHDTDGGSEFLEKSKAASGFSDRADILTLFDYYDVDEKRKA